MVRKLVLTGVMIMVLSAASHAFAEEVFVTPKGTKYHKSICRLVQNKDGITKMDKKEAIVQNYGPCGRCFKEDALSAEDNQSENQVNKIETKQKKG